MKRVTLSFFAAICLIGPVFGTECSSGPGYRFPITCPGVLDPKKSNCCEIGGSFRCCDEEEFARQDREYTDNIEPAIVPRYKRDDAQDERAKGIVFGIATVLLLITSVSVFFCCYCCFGYGTWHPTPGVIKSVQPSPFPVGNISQRTPAFPHQGGQYAPRQQDLPPQYHHSAATRR